MSEVYIVKTSGGSYEDRWTMNHKAFHQESDATDCVNQYNKILKEKRKNADECTNCYIDLDEFENAIDKNQYLVDKSKLCKRAGLHLDEDEFYICDNELNYWDLDENDAVIEVMEIE